MEALFSSMDSSIFFRLLFAVVLGGLIGLEREFHGRPAGLRTHILVCLAATMVMVLPEFIGYQNKGTTGGIQFSIDMGRIITGVLTGIGFLGAGAIIRIGDIVRGLTTAACVWFTAALGIVIGSGHFFLAIIVTVIALIVLLIFDRIGHLIPVIVYYTIKISLKRKKREHVFTHINRIFKENSIRVLDQTYGMNRQSDEMEITYQIRIKQNTKKNLDVVMNLGGLEGVTDVHWM